MFWNNKSSTAKELAKLLAEPRNKEEFLGVLANLTPPTPDQIRKDTSKLARYSHSSDYKVFADDTWARIIDGLDKILDARSTNEVRQYHCGAVKAMLDLLRVSYQARAIVEQYDSELKASLQPTGKG